jgi:hypothetical protein
VPVRQLGIDHIAAYSPEARGRSERAFQTHQGACPGAGPRGHRRHGRSQPVSGAGPSAGPQPGVRCAQRVAWHGVRAFLSGSLPDILCEQHERTVGNDNCVSFEGLSLQIPADQARYHYVRTRVRVHRYVDGSLALFHGPRKLATYDAQGLPDSIKEVPRLAA